MSTDEYVPDARYVRDRYAEHVRCYLGDAGERLGPEMEEGARAEFDRFLARVKRDAAREALDGLIDAWLGKYGTPETRDAGIAVRDYRETNYRLPEETP